MSGPKRVRPLKACNTMPIWKIHFSKLLWNRTILHDYKVLLPERELLHEKSQCLAQKTILKYQVREVPEVPKRDRAAPGCWPSQTISCSGRLPSQRICCCNKMQCPKQTGVERIYSAYTFIWQAITEEGKHRNSKGHLIRQELMERQWTCAD